MSLKLEKLVDNQWYVYGTYKLDDKWDLIAFAEACKQLGAHFELRVTLVSEGE